MPDRAEVVAGVADADLAGRTALVTGATGAIGREIALALDRLGARLLVHGRDREAGRALQAELGFGNVLLRADFSDRDAVRRLADAVREHADELDVLVNNAGAHFREGHLAESGVERTFAVNHLAPFLLTNLLAPRLAGDARVVTVASEVHRRADADDVRPAAVTTTSGYDGLDAYARSKLANVLFARELGRRLDGPLAFACHPGFVPGSGLWREASAPVRLAARTLAALPRSLTGRFVDTAAEAAATPVLLAAGPDPGADGAYFEYCERAAPSAAARDDDLARGLWVDSVRWAGLDGA